INYTVDRAYNAYVTDADLFELLDTPQTTGGSSEPTEEDYDETEPLDSRILSSSNGWQGFFDNLILTETVDHTTYTYLYYVEETSNIPGFETFYSDNNTAGVEGGVITVTNRSTTAIGPLPETGGRGNPDAIRIVGFSAVFLSLAVFLFRMYLPVYKKRRKSLN
ncbi:MAG: hypothetical protein IKS04_00330, partial [Clostridia bacterium]|nr:hypothetical protein [Clostridia bacterium]